ncbi:MAG: DUF2093 domain-containing protein [Roseitalea porphyridii]
MAAGGEAEILYEQANFRLLQPGDYVVCAVSGEQIALANLRYWNVERQEPYRDAWAALEAGRR